MLFFFLISESIPKDLKSFPLELLFSHDNAKGITLDNIISWAQCHHQPIDRRAKPKPSNMTKELALHVGASRHINGKLCYPLTSLRRYTFHHFDDFGACQKLGGEIDNIMLDMGAWGQDSPTESARENINQDSRVANMSTPQAKTHISHHNLSLSPVVYNSDDSLVALQSMVQQCDLNEEQGNSQICGSKSSEMSASAMTTNQKFKFSIIPNIS